MTPTDAARQLLALTEAAERTRDTKEEAKAYLDFVIFAKKQVKPIARALLDAEERERSAIEIINRILPYAMMTDDVREEVESAILKIIGTLEATGKAGG